MHRNTTSNKKTMSTQKLASITINQEGMDMILTCIQSHINHLNEWNFGDEYDTDTTPYHDLLQTMKQSYNEVWNYAEV
jgi:hypothetical protein